MRFNQLSCDKCGWKSQAPVNDEELKKFMKGTGGICQTCKQKGIKSEFRVRRFTVVSRSHRKG